MAAPDIRVDRAAATEHLHADGYAVAPGALTPAQCDALRALYDAPAGFRKTVVMERHRFGRGEYKYFAYPLPPLVQRIRTAVYPHLAPVANAWMEALGRDERYPGTHAELLAACHAAGQRLPTALILRYGPGGFNTLHQDLYGALFFPIQLVLFLDQAGVDHEGGEFVLTEQVPRAQSRAIVLRPDRGDVLLLTTAFRPVKGVRGHYRAAMRHGVSRVHSGRRHTLGIIFHDAVS